MDIEKVKELVRLMVDNELSSICVRDGSEEITLRRPSENGQHPRAADCASGVIVAPAQSASVPAAGTVAEVATQAPPMSGPVMPVEDALLTIASPMVGTFYAAPKPDAPAFVEIGSRVSPSTVVCIIEAMKVFNEIRAEVSGTIEKILVANQHAVEYGQPLFTVRPD